eukprot:m.62150 g.62150  ORF g.62150 m.62150 type:complete len:672 (+) comp12389_c0_seq1:70-2085(+)
MDSIDSICEHHEALLAEIQNVGTVKRPYEKYVACECKCKYALFCAAPGCQVAMCDVCCKGHYKIHAKEPGHEVGVRQDRVVVCWACHRSASPPPPSSPPPTPPALTTLPSLQERGNTGLFNLLNTCYLNAALQALAHIPVVASLFLDCPGLIAETKPNSLCQLLSVVVAQLWLSDARAVLPRDLVAFVRASSPTFSGYGQQDSEELFRFVLDKMHSELATARTGGVVEKETLVSHALQGTSASIITCETCGEVSTTAEPFLDLSLELPRPSSLARLAAAQASDLSAQTSLFSWFSSYYMDHSPFSSSEVALADCLRAYTHPEHLTGANQYHCAKCKSLQNATKMMRIRSLPDVLCIVLKRFSHDGYSGHKVTRQCSFPLEGLDLNEFTETPATMPDSVFDLLSIVCHQGSYGYGHYVTYARQPLENRWYCFDDTDVIPTDPATVACQQAYMLIYRKRVNTTQQQVLTRLRTLLGFGAASADCKVWISRYWLCRLTGGGTPGPIDNSEFACPHGGLLAFRATKVDKFAVQVPLEAWQMLFDRFGSVGPAVVSAAGVCDHCKAAWHALQTRRWREEQGAARALQRDGPATAATMAISKAWLQTWTKFIESTSAAVLPPGPIDNKGLVDDGGELTAAGLRGCMAVREPFYRFLHGIYGGGPEIHIAREEQQDSQ